MKQIFDKLYSKLELLEKSQEIEGDEEKRDFIVDKLMAIKYFHVVEGEEEES